MMITDSRMMYRIAPSGLPVAPRTALPPVTVTPAIPMPSASRIGVIVPWSSVSPIPASGPMRPVLTELMASSSISAPFARSSSMAMTMPGITAPHCGSVLKKTRCRLRAALMSSGVWYRRRMAGVIAWAKPVA